MPIYDLMEDAATAEICRTQIWQWIKLAEFLTLPAYDLLAAGEVRGDRMRQET